MNTGLALPSELQRFNRLPDLAYRGNGEWSSACPVCGGGGKRGDKSDRFRLFAANSEGNARAWCRRCNHFEWADQNTQSRPDPTAIQKQQEIRARLHAQEQERLAKKIQHLRQVAYWQGWHDAMGQKEREMWRRQGISDSLQDWFKLGYVNDHAYGHNGETYTSPAMTIPIFDTGWEAVNVQYRLTNAVPGAGKYRFTPGLLAPLFLTEPDQELSGSVLVVEGAKKAIVTWAHIGNKLKVVAVPSKMPGADLIKKLANCDPIYVGLDPDAYMPTKTANGTTQSAAQRLHDLIGRRARFVSFPAKPDDLLTMYGFTADQMMMYVNGATKAA